VFGKLPHWVPCALAATLCGCGATGDRAIPIAVTVEVDYGPANLPAVRAMELVPIGSSPADALAAVAPVVQGYVCCTKEDVWSVGGVATDFDAGLFWTWRLNGRRQVLAPDRYEVANGDRITWVYEHTTRPEHVRP